MNQQAEWQKAFAKLKNLISERQAFEKAHKDDEPFKSFPTTLDFCDVHGKSLLFYAIALGDEQAVSSLVEQGVNTGKALAEAFQHGQLKIAQHLYSKNVDAFSIALKKVTHPQCREWFINVIRKDVEDELAFRENFKVERPQNRTFMSCILFGDDETKINLRDRIAEIGDEQLLEKLKQVEAVSLTNADYSSMMNSAASNDRVPMLKFLLLNGASLNPGKPFENSAFIEAISSDSHNAIEFLLSQNIDINHQGEQKLTPLTWAVIKGNERLVDTLLKAGANPILADVNGRNVLHYAARMGNSAIIRRLLQTKESNALINTPDIFGLFPKDCAAQTNKQEIEGMLPIEPGTQMEKIVPRSTVSQSQAMTKMLYYLEIHYRDTQFFNKGGHCNGFTFLEEMYDDDGRADYYDDTLELIYAWDGEKDSLLKPFDKKLPQAEWYTNLGELFEHWTSHAIWFQHETLAALYAGGNNRQDQTNRAFQSQVVGVKRQPILISDFGRGNIDNQQFTEVLSLFSGKMVRGARLELHGSEHVTSASIVNQGQFKYKDPNFTRRTRPFRSEKEFSQVVIDTKIIANKKMAGSTFDCQAHFFYFENEFIKQSLREHKAFQDHELPTSMQEAEEYQKKSPNGYSHLMVAILTGSIITITKIISLGFYDLKAENKYSQTALHVALNTCNQEIVDLIMSLYNDLNLAPYSAFEDFASSRRQFKLKMVVRHYTKIDTLLPIVIDRISMCDYDNLHELLKLKRIDVNAYHQTNSPLIAAFKTDDLKMVNLILGYGASVFISNPKHNDDNYTPMAFMVTCDPTIVASLLKTQFQDINQTDDKGNGLIHYLPRANSSVVMLLLNEIRQRQGDIRKIGAEGKTIFDLLKTSFGDTKYMLYSELLPELTPSVKAEDAAILKELHQQATLIQDLKLLKILEPFFPVSSLNVRP